MMLAFGDPYAQVTVDTTGGTTGGAVASTPIANSVSSIGNTTTGASTSQGGAGGLGGTSSATSGASTSQGGSVGNLSTGASTSAGGSVGSVSTGASTSTGGSSSIGNTTTGASTSAGGSSNATGGKSSSSGNTSGNTTITSNYTAPKIPVATAVAPSNFPTAPCMGSSSIGGSAVLFGFSAGSSWEATECMTFEAARSFDQAGMHEDALAIKCTSKYSAAAPSCIRLKQQEQQAQQQQPAQHAQYESPKLVSLNPMRGIYSETVDPVTGFKTVIDTRDSHGRIAIPQ